MKKVIIIGAGFAGINLVKKLQKDKEFEIILVDKHNYHTFQPLLYQVATGGLEPSNIAYPIRRILRHSRTKFIMGEVSEIKTSENKIIVNDEELDFNYLVIATGSTNNFFNFVEESKNFLSLKSVSEALDIRSQILQNFEDINLKESKSDTPINFVIIGAGPAGVEVAGALSEMRNKVLPKDFPEFDFKRMNILLFEAQSKVLSSMSEKSSKYGLKYLNDLNVKVTLNAKVTEIKAHKLSLLTGELFDYTTIIWTAGVKGNCPNGLENAVQANGRILVNEFNQLFDFPNIFVIGDLAMQSSKKFERGLPMLAQVAIQQGRNTANNLLNLKLAKPLIPFKYKDKGSMATIGRNKAVVDLPYFGFQGAFAWFVWMFIHLIALIGFRNKIITLLN